MTSEARSGLAGSFPSVVRTAAKATLRRYGTITADRRPLPEFLIIGTKRGGTTSLWNYLISHPLVLPMFPSAQKMKSNAYFFSHYDRGPSWYRSHFATATQRASVERRVGHRPIAGEASPYYMYDPRVAERVRSVLPEVRLIVQLRNPVDRAYSHYGERVNAGVEPLSFEEALAAEPGRLQGEDQRMLADPYYYSEPHDWYSYRDRGIYAPQLSRWLELFPAEQIHIVRSEDLYADEQATVNQVVDFLGLPRRHLDTVKRHNYRPATTMAHESRAELEDFYRPHNARLFEIIGRDLGWRDRRSSTAENGLPG